MVECYSLIFLPVREKSIVERIGGVCHEVCRSHRISGLERYRRSPDYDPIKECRFFGRVIRLLLLLL